MQRGNVFGVTSLMHNGSDGPRISSDRLEDVEVLAMDERFRTRVWRYPRIAARIFFNLSTTLLDRLQYTLQRSPRSQKEGRSEEV